jgi:hypothetical protein
MITCTFEDGRQPAGLRHVVVDAIVARGDTLPITVTFWALCG